MKFSIVNRILLLIVILNINFKAHAQNSPEVQIPPIIPPSPEAFALGKIGDVPIGMSTGNPNFTLPLYKIESKHLSLPIELNYSSNGIKVDEISSNVGMGWVLNAGGIISRTVFGYVDNGTFPKATNPPHTGFSATAMTQNLIDWMNTVAGKEDTQPDVYNFNFNGYAGKFIINDSGRVVTMPFSNLKIEYNFAGSDWIFKITAPDGVVYYFGGSNATEVLYTSGGCGSNHEGGIPSSWYLTRIQHPYDPADSISFSYSNTTAGYSTSINETVTYWDGTVPGQYTCGAQPYLFGIGTVANAGPIVEFCRGYSNVSCKKLSQITDGKYTLIKFDYTLKPDVALGDSLVKTITVYNKQTGQIIKGFNFTYAQATPDASYINYYPYTTVDATTNLPRPFLTQVDLQDTSKATIQSFKLEYNDYSKLPPRLSFAQDYWGYFNAADNRSSFVPLPESHSSVLSSALIANRNPDYNATLKGTLKKITYPTGGYTTIQYEGNTNDTSYKGVVNGPTGFTKGAKSITATTGVDQTFEIRNAVTVTIAQSITCNCPNATGCTIQKDATAWGQLIQNGVVNTSFDFSLYNARGDCSRANSTSMTLQPGIYGLHLFNIAPYQFSLTLTVGSDSLYYYVSTQPVPGTTALASTGGGMRVKRTVTYDPVANDSLVKHYYYTDPVFIASPVYYSHITNSVQAWFEADGIHCVPDDGILQTGYHMFSSSSLANLYGAGNSPVYYRKVTESLGDNFENGGSDHYFSYLAYVPVTSNVMGDAVRTATAPNMNWRNGREDSVVEFKMVNNTRIPVHKVSNTYTIDQRNATSFSKYIIQKIGHIEFDDGATPPVTDQMADYNVAKVDYLSEWQYLSASTNQDYDLNGIPTISNTINYYYDNATHGMLTRTLTTDSKGYPVLETNRYPHDSASISSLTTTEAAAVNKLKTQGRIGEIIEKDLTRNSVLTQRIHNTYAVNSLGYPLIQSSQLQNGTSTPYTAYTINTYSSNGDILSMTPKDGVTKNYIWNYLNTLPNAEVSSVSPVAQADMAYTSFETDDMGTWTAAQGSLTTVTAPPYPPTGRKYYNMTTSSSLTKTGLTIGKKYVVSYWSKSGVMPLTNANIKQVLSWGTSKVNGWEYYEAYFVPTAATVSLTCNSTSAIDEVRLYPAEAQMKTYTYNPLIGMWNVCDETGHIVSYEYDSFGRLSVIRNQDGNILKVYDYQYQQPLTK